MKKRWQALAGLNEITGLSLHSRQIAGFLLRYADEATGYITTTLDRIADELGLQPTEIHAALDELTRREILQRDDHLRGPAIIAGRFDLAALCQAGRAAS